MRKILWLSRHDPTPSQVERLGRIYGPHVLVRDPRPFDSAEEIVERMRRYGCDEIVAVAPLSVIKRLVDLGVRPLWAEMRQVRPEEAETEVNGRHYKFVKFRRIVGIEIKFEEVE